MELAGFTATDFDAYLRSKWASNVYNLERLQVKQKLEALGRQLLPLLRAGDGSPLACEVSSEHPAIFNQRRVANQHLFFSRNGEARQELDSIISRARSMASLVEDPSPLRNHIFISVMIDSTQLETAVKVHSDAAVDRDNLLQKCNDFFQRERLIGLVHQLPPGFRVGLSGSKMEAAETLDDAALTTLLEQLPRADTWLSLASSTARDDAVARGASIVQVVEQQVTALLPLMHYIAWRRDNDFVSIRETLRQKDIQKKSKGLRKNDRIRVVQGMFAGKVGKVQSVDAKGGVKVLLGTMAIKLDGDDVTPL